MTPFRTLLVNLLVTLLLSSTSIAGRVKIELKDGTVHRFNTGDEVIVSYYASGTETHIHGVLKDLFYDTHVILNVDGEEHWAIISDIIAIRLGDRSQLPDEFVSPPPPKVDQHSDADSIFKKHPPLALLPILIAREDIEREDIERSDPPKALPLPDRVTFINCHESKQDIRWADALLKITFTLNELEYREIRLLNRKNSFKNKSGDQDEYDLLALQIEQLQQLKKHLAIAKTNAKNKLRNGLFLLTVRDGLTGEHHIIELIDREVQDTARRLEAGDICDIQYESRPVEPDVNFLLDDQRLKSAQARPLLVDDEIADIFAALNFGTEKVGKSLRITCHSIGTHRATASRLEKIRDVDPLSKIHVPNHMYLDRETIAPPTGVSCTLVSHRNSVTNRDYLLLKPALQGQVLRLLVKVSQKNSGEISKYILVEPAMEQYIEFNPRAPRHPLASDYQVDIIAAERTAPVTPAPKDPAPSLNTPAADPPPTSTP